MVAWFWTFAALVPLNHLGHYIHWGWFFISYANLTVIILMVLAFLLALFAPFPGKSSRRERQ